MQFYTNVLQYGNDILIREVNKGKRINKRVRYQPTLFDLVTSKEETGFKTLDGRSVLPHQFDTIKESKEWIEKRSDQPGMIFGNTQHSYNYIADTYSRSIEWDLDNILIVTIDIEVQCENGFPSAALAEEEML